jgi:pyruvate/2-oxoglutarate dehydrogenase complex dihydrolipoamide acyltransferase (E2) component
MQSNVIMPALGFDMVEGTIVKWLKHEGEHVEKGQSLAEIETGKAVVPIDAPASGTLDKIDVPEGQTVAVNTVIATLNVADDGVH